tara:strand:- start:150 stop:599 length:450 start_codon:yes stop_codon:yes gene_type:complete
MKYNFIILTVLFCLLFSKETIKSKEINTVPKKSKAINVEPIKPKEKKSKINNIPDHDLVKWSNEDMNINNPDYQYDMNKLMEQFKNDREIIIQEFKRKIEPYKNQRDQDMKNIKSLYSEKRKEIRQKYGIKRKPNNSDRKKIKNIENSK